MPTAQERYDIERKREIKNVPLLKILKALIDKSYNAAPDTAQFRLELQAAEISEDWDEYAKLNNKISLIEQVIIDITDEVEIEVPLPFVPYVIDKTRAVGNSDTIAQLQGVLPAAGSLPTAAIENSQRDDSSTSSDSDEEDCEPTVLDLKRGSMYASPQILLSHLSDYANKHNFTVRREKHAIVCSNAGISNWTAVTDYESRAAQAFRKSKKHEDQDVDESLQDFMSTEEYKVAILH
jgi:hypothetical protein